MWAYPEEAYEELRLAIARWSGADPAQIIPGHGIQALTLAVVATFVDPGDAVIVPRPTYGLYAQACAVAGARVVRVDNAPSLALDLEAIAAAATRARRQARLDLRSQQPDRAAAGRRPTGRRSWTRCPRGCLAVADEAYRDYIEPEQRIDRLADIRRRAARSIVLRTFSKIFGLAGLRLGYLLVARRAGAAHRRRAGAVQRQSRRAGGRGGQPAPDRVAARAPRPGAPRPSRA